jgi:hypothetical protein
LIEEDVVRGDGDVGEEQRSQGVASGDRGDLDNE